MFLTISRFFILLSILTIASFSEGYAQSIPGEEAAGRWDITVSSSSGSFPSWLEIKKSGVAALVGRFVGQSGSARPVSEIKFSPGTQKYSFTIPPQWSSQKDDLHFEFGLKGDQLTGWMTDGAGNKLEWTGVRAPRLHRNESPEWGTPVHLLEHGFSDWNVPQNSHWSIKEGVLINKEGGGNLITKQKFTDFKLHVEFRYPKESNSGIYLRGRYEAQVIDSYGMEPESHLLGGIYGFIEPSENAAKKAGQWQTYDITLTGRMVSVVLNGTRVICNREIPGITGGALDSNESEPGPIQLQGDHGSVQYRNITITPAEN